MAQCEDKYNKYSIKNIIKIILAAFLVTRTPLIPIPPPLLLTSAACRGGLSAKSIASRIISRQSEAGAHYGPLSDGSPNISEAMEVIRIEEIINALLTEAVIEGAVGPGLQITGAGANAGGAVVVQGATTAIGMIRGIMR